MSLDQRHEIVRTVDLDAPPYDTTIVVKVIAVFPTGIVTDWGTVAAFELLVKVKTNPPEGAGVEMLTVAVLDFPPLTDVGFSVRPFSDGGKIVNVADSVSPFNVESIFTVV